MARGLGRRVGAIRSIRGAGDVLGIGAICEELGGPDFEGEQQDALQGLDHLHGGSRVHNSGFRVQGSGFKVQGSGCRDATRLHWLGIGAIYPEDEARNLKEDLEFLVVALEVRHQHLRQREHLMHVARRHKIGDQRRHHLPRVKLVKLRTMDLMSL